VVPGALQADKQPLVRLNRRSGRTEDDDIGSWKRLAMDPEALADNALEPISIHGATSAFLGNSQAESGCQ